MLRILEDVLHATLEDKSWGGDDESIWAITMTDDIRARVKGSCIIMRNILEE